MKASTLPRPPRTRGVPIDEAEVSLLRLRLFGLLIVIAFGVLLARLWYLQVLHGEGLKVQAETNRRRLVRSPAPRGAVEDAKGRVLVTNDAQFTVFVDPTDLPKDAAERDQVLAALAEILGMTPDDLARIMAKNQVGASNPVPVAEGVDQHVLARIAENRLRLPGVDAESEPVRRYPNGTVAAHLLGYIGQISPKELANPDNQKRGYRPNDFIGKNGVEQEYDQYLNGEAGGVWYEIDARGRRQQELGKEETTPGATLRLGLDLDVQRAAEKGLAGMKGAAVAIDPRDGTVIAMASNPAFDPNLLAHRPLKHEVYKEQIEPGLFNRALMAEIPPGSTFKIVTAAAGLATGVVGPNTWVYCGGGMMVGNRFKKCYKQHGDVNLENAIAASCDTFFYHVGLDVKPAPLADWAAKFGLGQKTGIDLPGDHAGYIPSPARHRERALKTHNPDPGWYPGFTANMAIGQGEDQCTPMQMALVASAIANGGTVYAPRVVKEAVSADKKVVYKMEPKVMHQLGLTPTQIGYIARGMRSVIAGPRGTAHMINLAGVEVAGKTGSAEKHGGDKKESHAWFVCYAPYHDAKIAICVFLESEGQNYHGGANAGPIARSMMAAYFHIPETITTGDDTYRGD
jgi:penicillin-binding protein 2